MKSRKGYTLLELVIYLIFLSVISSIAMFSVTQIEKMNLRNDSIQLKNVLESMQKSALFSGYEYGVKFVDDSNYYSYYIDEQVEKVKIKDYYLNNGIKLISSNINGDDIRYTKRGTAKKSCEIYLGSTNFQVRITVEVGSGNVNVYEVGER